jgi:hypothetical protein
MKGFTKTALILWSTLFIYTWAQGHRSIFEKYFKNFCALPVYNYYFQCDLLYSAVPY